MQHTPLLGNPPRQSPHGGDNGGGYGAAHFHIISKTKIRLVEGVGGGGAGDLARLALPSLTTSRMIIQGGVCEGVDDHSWGVVCEGVDDHSWGEGVDDHTGWDV